MRVYAINIGPNLLEWRSARGLSPMRADTAQPIKLNDQFTGRIVGPVMRSPTQTCLAIDC